MHALKFAVYGTSISLETNSQNIFDEVLKDLRRYEASDVADTDLEVKLIEVEGRFPVKIPELAIRKAFSPPTKEAYVASDLLFLKEKDKYVITMDLKGERIAGYFKTSNNALQFALLHFLVKWVLIKSLENKRVFFIHGSGVADSNTTSLFIGPSGFGKTSILLALLQDGYRMVSDDTLLIRDGFILPFHLRSMMHTNTLKRFSLLKKINTLRNSTYIPRQGWLVDLEEIFPVERGKIRPSNLFFAYVWNSPKTKIDAVPKKEMLSRLLYCYREEYENSIWFGANISETLKKIFHAYSSILQNVNCYTVFVGSNLSGFVEKVKEADRG